MYIQPLTVSCRLIDAIIIWGHPLGSNEGFNSMRWSLGSTGMVSSSYSGPSLIIKMLSYQYRTSHRGDLHNGNSYTGKRASLHWIRPAQYRDHMNVKLLHNWKYLKCLIFFFPHAVRVLLCLVMGCICLCFVVVRCQVALPTSLYWWFYSWLPHDDVTKWKHFPRYLPYVRGIHRSPVNSQHKGQWRRALMFSLICAWINDWVNNRETGDLRRYRTHCDVTVMRGALCSMSYPSETHPKFKSKSRMLIVYFTMS